MSDSAEKTLEAERMKALTAFVMDNDDLVALEGRLTRFGNSVVPSTTA